MNINRIRKRAAKFRYGLMISNEKIVLLCDEVDRLTEADDQWVELVNKMEQATIKDKAEICRLREALEKIADDPLIEWPVAIAREALPETEEKDDATE